MDAQGIITSLNSINLDLLSVGVAITAIGLLGSLVYFNNPKSITNRTFFWFCLFTIFWGISNYLEYSFTTAQATLWALRIHIFVSVWHAFLFFKLAYVFPQEKLIMPNWFSRYIIPLVSFTAFLTLTPFVFSGIAHLAPHGQVTTATTAPGTLLFALVAFGLLIAGVLHLFRQLFRDETLAHRQLFFLFLGMFTTACLILLFNVVLPLTFDDVRFIPLAALFVVPFVTLTSYTIFKHHLFNVKVAATAVVAFFITVFSFTNIIYTHDLSGIVLNTTAFIIILLGSIRLVKSMLDLENANARLKELDRQKTEFVSIASHQLRSPLTAIKGYASLLLEKSFGTLPEEAMGAIQKIFTSSQYMAVSIEDFLNVSRIELGTIKFDKVDFDLATMVREVTEELTPTAEGRKLILTFVGKCEVPCIINGDLGKLRQVVLNLVDNAMKYTPKGTITVTATTNAKDKMARIEVKDTGVGIPKEIMPKLFGKFIRAANANEVNVMGTGLGLFVAKQFVESHGGRIWPESEGQGKGSTFIVEFPLVKKSIVAKK